MSTPVPINTAGSSKPARTTFHTLLVFRCPTGLSEQLADVATERHTSISAVIRDLLRDGLTSRT